MLGPDTNFAALLWLYPALLGATLAAIWALHRKGSPWARYVGISLLVALACALAWGVDFYSDGDWDRVALLLAPALAPVAALRLFSPDVDGSVVMAFIPLLLGVQVFLVALVCFAAYRFVRRSARPAAVEQAHPADGQKVD